MKIIPSLSSSNNHNESTSSTSILFAINTVFVKSLKFIKQNLLNRNYSTLIPSNNINNENITPTILFILFHCHVSPYNKFPKETQ